MRFAIPTVMVAFAGSIAVAHAAPDSVVWPTFFRVGPSQSYKVVDELLRGTVVDVRACADQWCQVQIGRVVGYVEQSSLAAAAPPATHPATGPACFDSVRAGYGKGEVWRYCP